MAETQKKDTGGGMSFQVCKDRWSALWLILLYTHDKDNNDNNKTLLIVAFIRNRVVVNFVYVRKGLKGRGE